MTEQPFSEKDLRRHWSVLRSRIDASSSLCILLDFDGALVSLGSSPNPPHVEGEACRVLESLSRDPKTIVGIVSGRSLTDLVARFRLERLWYVGNHGFEMRDPRGEETYLYEPQDLDYLGAVRDQLDKELHGIPGVSLENKGPILAVRYRGVDAARMRDVERGFIKVMDRHRSRLMMATGDAVFEARLRGGATRGIAIRRIRCEQPAGTLVLYFGDRDSGRDAFRELRGAGVSVDVGGRESSIAEFTLPDPEAVLAVLCRLQAHLQES